MKKSNNPLISIIVPIYNAKSYLDQCIKSILIQTYYNFELLLIDDGSKDNSLDICLKYQKNDKRIKVINKDNEGIERTRKLGINISKGEYICFIDADDWIDNNYIYFIVNKAITHDVDLVCVSAFKTLDKWGFIKRSFHCFPEQNLSKADLKKYHNIYVENLFPNNVWGKLYKSELLKKTNLQIAGVHHGEDLFINLQLSPYINSIYTSNYFGYYYRYGGSTANYDSRYWTDLSKLYWIRKEYAEIYDPKHIEYLKWQLYEFFYANIKNLIFFSKKSDVEIYDYIETVFNSPYYNEFIVYNKEILSIIKKKDAIGLFKYIKKRTNKISIIKTKVLVFLFRILN